MISQAKSQKCDGMNKQKLYWKSRKLPIVSGDCTLSTTKWTVDIQYIYSMNCLTLEWMWKTVFCFNTISIIIVQNWIFEYKTWSHRIGLKWESVSRTLNYEHCTFNSHSDVKFKPSPVCVCYAESKCLWYEQSRT